MSSVDPERRTRAEEQAPDPYVGRTFDGFRIEEVIGRGGMGVVYKATQLSLNRPVAIKVIPEQVAEHPQFLERFRREVDVLSRLSHPNIVTVIDRGELDGHPYLVMEYVAGTSLREVLKEGPLPAHEALVVVRGVLSALEHAHDRGIIHRDIKPENVLVAPGGIVKVADFGLGRLLGPAEMTRLTHTHLMLGTFEYMAPEQREKAKEADARSDLYATGVVLYELIAGELPIGHFERLSDKRPSECDSRVDRVVERSLEKSPERRYQRASEMGEAVSQLLTPVPLAPEPAPARLRDDDAHHRAHLDHHDHRGHHHHHDYRDRREHMGRVLRGPDWRLGFWLTALWVVPTWILSPKPWRNESLVWIAVAVGASMGILGRWAARRRFSREDWRFGIGGTAFWVALVCIASHKPWRDEEILWLGVGAVVSAFLIPRLKEAGKLVGLFVFMLSLAFAAVALFWSARVVAPEPPEPIARDIVSTVSTTTYLLCTLPESESKQFDMSFFEDPIVRGWVGGVTQIASLLGPRRNTRYLDNPGYPAGARRASVPGTPGLWVRFREGDYSAEQQDRIVDAWKLALYHWRGVDVAVDLPRQRLQQGLRRYPLPETEGHFDYRYHYFVAARPSGPQATFPPEGAREWVAGAVGDIPAARWGFVHVSMHDGFQRPAGDAPVRVTTADSKWGLWVELDDDAFSAAERHRIVNAWALAFSHFYGVRQTARPWKDLALQAQMEREHPLPRIAENGDR